MLNKQNYIGNLFEIENQNEESIWLHFDVFIGRRETVMNFTIENILLYETGLFRINLSNDQFYEFFSLDVSKAPYLLDKWFELKGDYTKEVDSIPAFFYTFDFTTDNQPQNIFFNKGDISVIRGRKKEDKILLNKISSLVDLKNLYDKKKTKIAIKSLTSSTKSVGDFSDVNVVSFNVGQGNATGVFDKAFNPIIYYDLGGGAYWNKFTYPTVKTFPINGSPIIILSHWDFDHYESIKANPSHYSSCKIIAPLQKSTPCIRKFAGLISSNLYLIDKELGNGKDFSFMKLFKCTGKKRNDSGLGILLDLKKKENISKILLPGDSQYFYIKVLKKVDAICVSHHGGKIYNKKGFPVPNKKGNGYCVYSCGTNNTYSHPKHETILEHKNKGWGINKSMKEYSLDTKTYNIIYSSDIKISAFFDASPLKTLGKYNSFHGLIYNRLIKLITILL